MLIADNCLLLVVDAQERLASLMYNKEKFLENLAILIKGAKVFGTPILYSEQAPDKIGRTIAPIAELLDGIKPIEKVTFSCCADAAFMQALGALGQKQILLAGIEAHVCVYQTAIDLVNLGYDVHVVADAVSSRTEENKQIGVERMKESGTTLTSTEMALCELLQRAEGAKFKKILKLIK